MRKILLILESRASYGYSKNLLNLLKKNKEITTKTLVTGTHLSKELGLSLNNLKKDKIKIDYSVRFYKKNFAQGIGKLIIDSSKVLNEYKPDIVVIFGDRVELMAIAIGCSYNKNILLAHVQAGDRSGHIDDMTRMALAKLSHLHFPATEMAYKRLLKLGEDKKRIHLVGAPQLDDIDYNDLSKKKFLNINNNKIDLNEKYIVLLQHPVFKDQSNYANLFQKTLTACLKLNCKIYIIYPNYDPGYESIIKKIKSTKKLFSRIRIFKHIDRGDYLTLVINALALVGNSSSGILESPSLKIGTVNIGDRQNLREQNRNIYNAKYSVKDIYNKLIIAINSKNNHTNIKNIHGDGKSSKRIYNILKKIKSSEFLLTKNTTY